MYRSLSEFDEKALTEKAHVRRKIRSVQRHLRKALLPIAEKLPNHPEHARKIFELCENQRFALGLVNLVREKEYRQRPEMGLNERRAEYINNAIFCALREVCESLIEQSYPESFLGRKELEAREALSAAREIFNLTEDNTTGMRFEDFVALTI